MRYSMASRVLGLAFAMSACSDSTSPSTTGASLDAVSPTPGATGVDPATVMTMRFSAAMQTSMMQYVDLHQGTIAGSVVPMTCSWSSDATTLACQPNQPLQPGATYALHLGSGMTDAAGQHVDVEQHGMAMGGTPVTGDMTGGMHDGQSTSMMGGGWIDPTDDHLGMAFTFTTASAATQTSLVAVSPAPGTTGVDPSGTITMTFSGAMLTSMMQYVDLHQGTIAGPVVPMTCSWSNDNTTLTCQPNQPLQPGTSYVLHMGGGMMNANGDPVDVEHHGMTIGGQPVSGGMMGGMHGGQGTGMMGSGWMDPDGHYGMEFTFTTA